MSGRGRHSCTSGSAVSRADCQEGGLIMIQRIDRLPAEIPPPTEVDADGASIVQELLGGKFGEMSTFMNYTFQSFNFRKRQNARPFYDLIASIAAEEFAHIE